MTFQSAASLRAEQAAYFLLDPQTPGGGHPPALAFGLTGRRAVALASRWSRSELSPDAMAGGVA